MVALATAGALIVGMASIYYSNDNAVQQSKTQMQFNKISVLPVLSSKAIFDSEYDFSGFGFKNKGLGPAIISKSAVYFSGREVRDDIDYAQNKILKARLSDDSNFLIELMTSELIINKGETVWLYKTRVNSPENSRQLHRLAIETGYSVCYCSLYKECRVIHLGTVPRNSFSC